MAYIESDRDYLATRVPGYTDDDLRDFQEKVCTIMGFDESPSSLANARHSAVSIIKSRKIGSSRLPSFSWGRFING
jgi:hypothetical protein